MIHTELICHRRNLLFFSTVKEFTGQKAQGCEKLYNQKNVRFSLHFKIAFHFFFHIVLCHETLIKILTILIISTTKMQKIKQTSQESS